MIHALLTLIILAAPPSQTPSLIRTVLDANRLVKTIDNADDDAKRVIVDAGIMKGKQSVLLDFDKVSKDDAGDTIIQGRVTVMHPDRERYRTEEERKAIKELNDIIEVRKKDLAVDVDLANKRWKADWPKGSPKEPRRFAHYKVEKAKHDKNVRQIKAKGNAAIKEATKLRDNYLKKIKAGESARREQCEVLPVVVRVPESLAAKLDMTKLLKKSRVKTTVTITEFTIAHEPEEIGGAIYVNWLDLKAVSIGKPKS